MLCIGGFFYLAGSQWGSNKAALTHQRQSNQQPSGLLVSLRFQSVGMSTKANAVLMLCIGGFFSVIWWGIPVGLEQHDHYFLLKKHVQNTSGRNGSCVLCTCFLLFGIHPNGQRLICCRICAISALE